jgi:PBP1b-binding outer membrane lipoprotein LpoB
MSYMKWITTVVLVIFLLVGCKEKPKAIDPKGKDEASAKTLEAADLVGYDGKHLRKTTDRVLDANDKHNQDIQKTLDDNK